MAFTKDQRRRIARATREHEHQPWNRPPLVSALPSDDWSAQWFKLSADLDPETHSTTAYRGKWNKAGNDSYGALTANEDDEVTIYDVTESMVLAAETWVRCKPIGADRGTIWQIVTTGSVPIHWGTLDADLAYNNTTGVAVTLDIGGTQAGVLPPKGMTEGTFPAGAHVKVERIDGDWYVTYCSECAE